MLDIQVKTEDSSKLVVEASKKAAFRNFQHAAASISKEAKSSIESADGPSAPGSPPHTHRGAFLRKAIRYAADAEGAVIGPVASIVGTAGSAHEFGGEYKGTDFPARPVMGPVLERAVPRLAGNWTGSIGQ